MYSKHFEVTPYSEIASSLQSKICKMSFQNTYNLTPKSGALNYDLGSVKSSYVPPTQPLQDNGLTLNYGCPNLISNRPTPAISVQPEPVMECYLGGYATIMVGVSGCTSFRWEEICGSNVTYLRDTARPMLTLFPISYHHLNCQYRMLATDQHGNSVVTQTSRFILKQNN